MNIMTPELTEKINTAIALLRRGERLALAMQHDHGYFVGFSGGKDSQVVLELCRLAGVRYHAYYNVTTIDPPDNVRFIRERYQEVTFIHPKQTFMQLIARHGMPTMTRRFCCERLKEGAGAGFTVLTGVRAEESAKRSRYNELDIRSRRKEHADRHTVTLDTIEQNEHRCIKGKDKVMLYPILRWTQAEVWEFIQAYGLPVNPCYERGGRVGCMFCPFASKQQIDEYEAAYPKYKDGIIRALRLFWQKSDEHYLPTPEEYYEWWKSKKSVKDYKREKAQTSIQFNDTLE